MLPTTRINGKSANTVTVGSTAVRHIASAAKNAAVRMSAPRHSPISKDNLMTDERALKLAREVYVNYGAAKIERGDHEQGEGQ